MKKTIFVIGLLLAGCDDSSNTTQNNQVNPQEVTNSKNGEFVIKPEVAYFMKPENDQERRRVSSSCMRSTAKTPECINVGQANALLSIMRVMPTTPSVEEFMNPNDDSYRYEAALSCENPTLTDSKNFDVIPVNHPICQNYIAAAKQAYEECVINGSAFTSADKLCYDVRDTLERRKLLP
ncbi:MAG TPA: hypothetical protein PKC68_00205 [Alphaproteobacteria bacterium]|nr:hypothetical protein [Alphaproteobacteria bacterium]